MYKDPAYAPPFITDQLADPAEVLFGVQLGGGTDINSALAYCEKQIEIPTKTAIAQVQTRALRKLAVEP